MLVVDSVQLQYSGRQILSDVALTCQQGEIIGLIGRNGCGKSSLLKVIFGSIEPDYKYISIDGNFINTGYLNNNIAYLPQQNFLPKNIQIKKLAVHLVDTTKWDEFEKTSIYQQYKNDVPANLSGGELRKLETIIILFSKAKYALLDEPFSHISPIQIEEISEIIRSESKCKGIIITDHQYSNVLEIASRLIIIQNGATKKVRDSNDLIAYGYLRENMVK